VDALAGRIEGMGRVSGYGKLFESTYTGSMAGSGSNVFAVWTYCIATANRHHEVYLNEKGLSVILGEPIEHIEQAINYLCSPDPNSRSKVEDGRRLIKVVDVGCTYRVVNHSVYKELLSVKSCDYKTDKFLSYALGRHFSPKTSTRIGYHRLLDWWSEVKQDVVVERIGRMDYQEFLKTWYWRVISCEVKRRANWRCSVCSKRIHLEVHHENYKIRGREIETVGTPYLVALCRHCHGRIHGRLVAEIPPAPP